AEATSKGMVDSVLIGDAKKIEEIIKAEGLDLGNPEIIEAEDDIASAVTAVKLIAEGKGDVLLKGILQTADLLRQVVNKEYGLLTGEIMSHCALFQIPDYHKLMILTDGGMVLNPDAVQKRYIVENAVRVMHNLGVAEPKVAALCATEVVNPKMQASVDADILKQQNQSGEIKGCYIEGPISFDLTWSKESAAIKKFESPVTGDADILLFHDMVAGNVISKAINYIGHSTMAGIIVGAKVPIVIVSRGGTAEEKYLSLVCAAAASDE
ncbi:MAG: phosphate butyryltransferase, partial [Clostridiales Family XIII bacterium]|nr:phosphate butyryltransferase [Clostridiales Family XIII bacterium]